MESLCLVCHHRHADPTKQDMEGLADGRGQYCVLCGVYAPLESIAGQSMRVIPLTELRSFIQSWCVPTNWHFAALLGICDTAAQGNACSMCTKCSQWRRRTGHRKNLKKRHTPFDSVLLHLMAPGEVEKPDRRSLRRVLTAMDSPLNMYRALIPAPVRFIVSSVVVAADDTMDDVLLLCWWDVNERTPFFRCGATARCFRQMFKRHRRTGADGGTGQAASAETDLD